MTGQLRSDERESHDSDGDIKRFFTIILHPAAHPQIGWRGDLSAKQVVSAEYL